MYETYLAFAGNSRVIGVQARSSLKEMATILGEEGWRICAVWPSMQGGQSGFAILCQRPIQPSIVEGAGPEAGDQPWVEEEDTPRLVIEEVYLGERPSEAAMREMSHDEFEAEKRRRHGQDKG